MITANRTESENFKSAIKQLVRPNYTFPPLHGARLINTVLESEELTKEWERELKVMSTRMFDMR